MHKDEAEELKNNLVESEFKEGVDFLKTFYPQLNKSANKESE